MGEGEKQAGLLLTASGDAGCCGGGGGGRTVTGREEGRRCLQASVPVNVDGMDGWVDFWVVGMGDGRGTVRIKLHSNGNAEEGATHTERALHVSVYVCVWCVRVCEAHATDSSRSIVYVPLSPRPFAAIPVPRRARVCRAFELPSRCLFYLRAKGRAGPACGHRPGWLRT